MQEKVYLNFFILCFIFSKGVVGTFLEDDIGESSNVLDREKRVINREHRGDVPLADGERPYVVNIKKNNKVHCVGSILSHRTVITAARCFTLELSSYLIYSGASLSLNQISQVHRITEKKVHGHYPSRASTFMTGIALVTVNPPFNYSYTTSKIDLHIGPVLAGMYGWVSGWGSYYYGGPRESAYSTKLRSISVPIMRHRDCVFIYRNLFAIGDEDICTYHPKKLCGHTDVGAPLVIDNELVGVHIGAIDTAGKECSIKPDVFLLLQHLNYGPWIRRNIVD